MEMFSSQLFAVNDIPGSLFIISVQPPLTNSDKLCGGPVRSDIAGPGLNLDQNIESSLLMVSNCSPREPMTQLIVKHTRNIDN